MQKKVSKTVSIKTFQVFNLKTVSIFRAYGDVPGWDLKEPFHFPIKFPMKTFQVLIQNMSVFSGVWRCSWIETWKV